MRMNLTLATAILALTACASLDKAMTGQNSMPDEGQRRDLASKFTDATPEQREKFAKGEPWIGMTQAQLNALFGGEPSKRQNKLTAAGKEDIELFAVREGDWKTGVTTKYFKAHVVEGKLTEVQELDGNVGSFDKL